MLVDSYNLFLNSAKKIPGFKAGTKEDYNDIEKLANGYCLAEFNNNKDLQASYLSALMIRYWYMIPFVYDKMKSLRIDIEDVVGIIYDALMKAFKYKSWLDTTKDVSKEKNGAEKCINRCIDSVRQAAFQQSNTDSRKLFYMTYSMEESIEKFGDASETLSVEEEDLYSSIHDIVDYKLKKKDILGALLIDSIVFNDCFVKNNFSITKMVSGIQEDYIKSFKSRYVISEQMSRELTKLLTQSRRTLNRVVKAKLIDLQADREMISHAF